MICRFIIFALIGVLSMPTTSVGDSEPPVPKEVASDLQLAKTRIDQLNTHMPDDLPWHESLYPALACLSPDGPIRGYQATYRLKVKADDVGSPLDVKGIFYAARQWLKSNGYEMILDTIHENGTWDIRAVNEADEIGISIRGYDQIIGMDATTKCRDV